MYKKGIALSILLSGSIYAQKNLTPAQCTQINNIYDQFTPALLSALNVDQGDWSESNVKKEVKMAIFDAVEYQLVSQYRKATLASPSEQKKLGNQIFGFLGNIDLAISQLKLLHQSLEAPQQVELIRQMAALNSTVYQAIEAALESLKKQLNNPLKIEIVNHLTDIITNKSYPQLAPVNQFYNRVMDKVKARRQSGWGFGKVTDADLRKIFNESFNQYGCKV